MQGERPQPRRLTRSAALLAIAATLGCAGSQGFQLRKTTSASFLRVIEESNDPNVRWRYDSLASGRCYDNEDQKVDASRVLAAKMKAGKEPTATRAVICRTLGKLGKPDARDVVLTAASDEDALVRAEACRSLGKVGRPEDSTILARVMATDVSGECRIAAIESLGTLKSTDRRINEFLVAGMEHDDPAIRVASMNALKLITGKDLGVDAIAWKKYIESLYPPAPAVVPDVVVDPPPAKVEDPFPSLPENMPPLPPG